MKNKDLLSSAQALREKAKRNEYQSWCELWETTTQCSEILKKLQPIPRKQWIERVSRQLYEEQGGICPLCGEKVEYGLHDVDHIIAHTHGGGNERGNLQITHRSCNRSKGKAVDLFDLIDYLEDRAMNL